MQDPKKGQEANSKFFKELNDDIHNNFRTLNENLL